MKRGSKVFWSSSSAVSKRREVHNARRNYVTLINPPFSLLPLDSPLSLLVPASLTPCRHPRRSDSRQALLIPQMVPMKRKWVTLLPFAEDFTVNLRIPVAFRVPLRSRAGPEIHRDSAVLFNLFPGSVRRAGRGCAGDEEFTIFSAVESPDDSCYSRAIPIHRRAKPGLSDSRLLSPSPPPVFLIRQVIQIKLLRKLLLYSSARLSSRAEMNSRACQAGSSVLRGSVDHGYDFSARIGRNRANLNERSSFRF